MIEIHCPPGRWNPCAKSALFKI